MKGSYNFGDDMNSGISVLREGLPSLWLTPPVKPTSWSFDSTVGTPHVSLSSELASVAACLMIIVYPAQEMPLFIYF